MVVCVASWVCGAYELHARMSMAVMLVRTGSPTGGRCVRVREVCHQPAVGWFTNLSQTVCQQLLPSGRMVPGRRNMC